MTLFPLDLTESQKETLVTIADEIKQFDWEVGEYLFHDFIEYFQLPQIIRVSQPWDTNLVKNDILYLQSMYDRHLILSKSLLSDERTFILPDWFQGQCRVLSSNPTYKSRWWQFTNAMELLRFEMPREHIRLLRDTSALLLLPTNQTIPVLLKENTEVTLKRIEKSTTITNGKEMFVLGDKNDQEFLLDPTQATDSFHFATKILDDEFDKSYHKNTSENLFTLPEIIIRYELPLDIEIVSLADTIPIENFPTQLRLEKYSIAKSIIAVSIGDPNQPRILELSSLTQFSLQCVTCLTTGLPRDSTVDGTTRVFDENAYRQYESVREKLVQLLEDASIQYMRTPFVGEKEEVDCIAEVYNIGMQLKREEKNQTYTVIGDADSTTNDSNNGQPSINNHPTRFTVHLPVDFNSPYSSIMEVSEEEEDDHEVQPPAAAAATT
ncbi:unnamed protein product [Adineta steineri]|uniref:Uncharacterized protein n=2 Tax=Adineta steineri TaxID=433720 RepID=A0A814VMS7_9BILA|nr:unnamed protein product [Adineta steineri]CAF3527795.1 unnamed protein product [Adineta steineri]